MMSRSKMNIVAEASGDRGASAQRIRTTDTDFRVARLEIGKRVPILPFDRSDTEASEQYRVLRTNIRLHPAAPKVIAISSAMPRDGKTVTAINTSAILALKEDSRVLLIDGDLRQQGVARTVGLQTEFGLSDLIARKCTPAEAIVVTDQIPNLHVLTAGTVASNPAELLDSDSFRSLISTFKAQFSYIIFDTPPITAVADFKLVQQVCDGFILVVRPDFTNRFEFVKALEIEPREKLLGVVVNAFRKWFLFRHPGGYYYRSRGSQAAVGR